MKDGLEKLTAIAYQLFSDQVKVYDVGSLDEKKSSDSMLHQHFFEPLSEGNLQKLARQIADF